MTAPTFLAPRPAVPLSKIAAQSERNQAAAKGEQIRIDMARSLAERTPVEPCLYRMYEAAAKHAADRAFWLGRAAVYLARGDGDISDCIGQSAAAGERLAAVERQIKEFTR